MFTLIFAPVIITIIIVSIIARILLRPYWSPYRRHGFYFHRHRHGGLLPLLAILAIGRLFGRRW